MHIYASKTTSIWGSFSFGVCIRVECLLVFTWIRFESMNQHLVNGHVLLGRTCLFLLSITSLGLKINFVFVHLCNLRFLIDKTRSFGLKFELITTLRALVYLRLMLNLRNRLNLICLCLLRNSWCRYIINSNLNKLFRLGLFLILLLIRIILYGMYTIKRVSSVFNLVSSVLIQIFLF